MDLLLSTIQIVSCAMEHLGQRFKTILGIFIMTSTSIHELPSKTDSLEGQEYIILSKKVSDIWKSFKCKLQIIKEFLKS